VEQTLINAHAALSEFEVEPQISWVSDIYQMSVLRGRPTPAVIVNGRVKSSGRIPSVYEFSQWIQEELAARAVPRTLEEVAA
jgi:hypothetical protein